jgi:phosphatidylethanolamine-binding protein (PEBP) family uncharacterized protein
LKIWNRTSAGAAALLVAIAIAGCGSGSGKSASVAAATTATTPATTSTASKQPSKTPAKTTPSKTATTPSKPPAKASTKTGEAAEADKTFGKIKLTSTAFKAGGPIGVQYTCDGAGTSPPLEWHDVPHGTVEMFLIAIDLTGGASDAIQWAVAGIPPSASAIPAGSLPAGAVAGLNSEGKAGWGGICGAKGQQHHVAFLFYALSRKLGLKAGFNPVAARGGLKGSALATGLTVATYRRP